MNRISFLVAAVAVSGLGLVGCDEKRGDNANNPPPANMNEMYGKPPAAPGATQPADGATTQDATDAAQPSAGTVGGAIDDATNRVSEGAKDAAEGAKEAGSDAAEGAREAGRDLSEGAGNLAEQAGDKAKEAGDAAEEATDNAGDAGK